MTLAFKGSCLCGALSFEAKGKPLFQGFCQCVDCQKASGGHSAAITMNASDVIISGKFSSYDTIADSGATVHRNFCPTCGCRVFNSYPGAAAVVSFAAVLLDEPEVFTPEVVLYSWSAPSWDHIDPSVPRSNDAKTASSYR